MLKQDQLNMSREIVSGIYALCYKDEVIYVGKSRDIRKRIASHCGKTKVEGILKQIQKEDGNFNRTKQLALYLFIKEHYEDDNLSFKILETNVLEKNLDELEKKWIEYYKPRFNLVGVLIPYELREENKNEDERC